MTFGLVLQISCKQIVTKRDSDKMANIYKPDKHIICDQYSKANENTMKQISYYKYRTFPQCYRSIKLRKVKKETKHEFCYYSSAYNTLIFMFNK